MVEYDYVRSYGQGCQECKPFMKTDGNVKCPSASMSLVKESIPNGDWRSYHDAVCLPKEHNQSTFTWLKAKFEQLVFYQIFYFKI